MKPKLLIQQMPSLQPSIGWQKKNLDIFGTDLSFSNIPEWQRTKHVHRLHPYLGKFIPQLVEVFLRKFFKNDKLILDPFAGSGTTLIEANVLGKDSIGIELSEFSHLIAKVKTDQYDLELLRKEILDILNKTSNFSKLAEKGQKNLIKNLEFQPTEYFKQWYLPRPIKEIYFYRNLIENYRYKDVLKIILSRAARSARAIAHFDLARPRKPVKEKYWCIKHKRYCFPTDNAITFLRRYSFDTIKRIEEFSKIRTENKIILLKGDSRKINLNVENVDGIFTSPPYLGLIDYHDQHRYAFDLFNFKENGELEIGSPKENGKNKKEKYKDGMVKVFNNMLRFMKDNAKIFIVVNDKGNLYPEIAKRCGLKIVDIFHRPVLFRTERDHIRFSESIYYLEKDW